MRLKKKPSKKLPRRQRRKKIVTNQVLEVTEAHQLKVVKITMRMRKMVSWLNASIQTWTKNIEMTFFAEISRQS